MKTNEEKMQPWWKAPEDDDEHHTAYMWSIIEIEARKAGDLARAEEAKAAKEQEERSTQ